MPHWLLKTEPEEWSWDDQARHKTDAWTGVRNHQAANHLRAMYRGDEAFFYHTGKEKRIVGIVRVVRPAYPDPTDDAGRFVAVDVKAVRPVKTPVTLKAIRAEPALADLMLLRHSRLSVMPVSDEHWNLILNMAGGA